MSKIRTDLWVGWPRRLVVLDKGHSGLKNGVDGVGTGVGVSKLLSEGGPPLPPLAQPHLCFSKFTQPALSTLSLTTKFTLCTRNNSIPYKKKSWTYDLPKIHKIIHKFTNMTNER